jgi:hypothetical protein
MNIRDAIPFMRVAYIPGHAHGDINHKDVERGVISSKNDSNIFVRFDGQLKYHRWDNVTGISCSPDDLELDNTPLINHRGETVIVLANGLVDDNLLK